uniref:Uncharacterized protein n=1 Tax=Trypanosoma congolense (strain IL3000) TaxID=1068625 RepID=G0V0A7_TRYCI|nr:conserved hypothetical protein [Trypanosoma congolense IL3000]
MRGTDDATGQLKSESAVKFSASRPRSPMLKRVSSTEYIREKTEKLEGELHHLISRNRSRYNRLQSMRNRLTSVEIPPVKTVAPRGVAELSEDVTKEPTDNQRLPNLFKSFQKARTKSLLEYDKKREAKGTGRFSMPHAERLAPDGMKRSMKGPESFIFRFCKGSNLNDFSISNAAAQGVEQERKG